MSHPSDVVYLKCSKCGCLRPPKKLKATVAGATDVTCKDEKSCAAAVKFLQRRKR